ncbi:hypothetical protein [Mycobacterium tilburgii]|uniref:hypothetical protein n=1 Tax=Mycobacterium tilburgii TaxID=44467 RepID=UPI001183A4AF|nr:hypothetical protein [Mycobacterium tilburgii]
MTAEFSAQPQLAVELDVFSDMPRGPYPLFPITTADVRSQQFSTTIREQRLGQMWLVDEVTLPHTGTRTTRHQGTTARDVVDLQYPIAGARVHPPGRRGPRVPAL